MTLFTTVLAEATELTTALEGLPAEEAAAAVGITSVLGIAWTILQIIADWKIFTKAGEPGWKSLIPIYNVFIEYDISWNGMMGLVYCVAVFCANVLSSLEPMENWKMILAIMLLVVALILHIMQSLKLARAFGKGTGFGICLILFGPIARLVLGFGSARYIGKE